MCRLFLSIAIAVPLFQTARDEGAWRFPYADVHGHAWTNVVLWFACWLFVGIVFALAWLLAALFDLIGMHFLQRPARAHWFAAVLAGAAFGGALGLLRERDGRAPAPASRDGGARRARAGAGRGLAAVPASPCPSPA